MPHICCVAIAPLRAEPSDKSEMTSQVLFGETVVVVEEQPAWYKVRLDFDGYEGWVDRKQFLLAKEKWDPVEYFLAHSTWKQVVHDNVGLPVPMGSVLWKYKNGSFSMGNGEKWNYNGWAEAPLKKYDFQAFQLLAGKFIGAPYLWGGRTPFGVDCSGLVQQLYLFFSIHLPRDAWQQAEKGKEVPFKKMKQGDLAFFRNREGRIVHVGIVWDHKNRLILHASGQVRIDRLEPEGIINRETGIQSHAMAFIKNVT